MWVVKSFMLFSTTLRKAESMTSSSNCSFWRITNYAHIIELIKQLLLALIITGWGCKCIYFIKRILFPFSFRSWDFFCCDMSSKMACFSKIITSEDFSKWKTPAISKAESSSIQHRFKHIIAAFKLIFDEFTDDSSKRTRFCIILDTTFSDIFSL